MVGTDLSDQELLGRIRAGDKHAFELLFRSYYPGLLRFSHAHLGDREEAEDAVHDVFLRVWSERERLGGDRSPRTYLLAAVRNRVTDILRHRVVERRWIDRTAERSTGARPDLLDVAVPISPADPAGLAELDAAIRRAVADLPERCRTAFVLCREQGLSYAEAAEVMAVSPATVKTQMARALAALRVALDPFLVVVLTLSPLLR